VRIVVTGANGFVGSRIVERLVREGRHVVAVGRGIARRDCEVVDERFDRCDWSRLGPCDALLHFAAINDTSVADEAELQRVNVDAALTTLEAAAAGCRRIVYASTLHVYGHAPAPLAAGRSRPEPVTAYGRSKLALEREAAAFAAHRGVGCVGLRLANVYGPGEGHKGRMASQVLQIARQMREGDPEIFAPGTQVRDFVHVDDVAAAAVAAVRLADAPGHRLLDCGSGLGTSFNELVSLLNAALGLKRQPRYIPEPAGYLRHVVLDVADTVARLDWHPRPLAAGIADYLAAGELA
jgi:ADP-L-glycero-D-manno-heptose 6-epimerase